jgi:uncharacterized alpha-E superfamily protein
MLCRVADGLYWIGRYLERAEHRARVLEVNLDLMLYQTPDDVTVGWRRMCDILRVPLAPGEEPDPLAIAYDATMDAARRDSIVYCIARARENARQVREVISSEMWAQINHVFLRMPLAGEPVQAVPSGFHQTLRRQLHLFEGITDATFLHGEGWRFLRLGRFIERAIATARLLGGYLDASAQARGEATSGSDLTWLGLLQSCTAVEAYTRRYTADPRPRNIAEFLLLSHEFPHSLRFSVEQACAVLQCLEGNPTRAAGSTTALSRGAGRLRAQLEFGAVDEILDDAAAYLGDVQIQCMRIHELVQEQYIAYPVELASVFAQGGA